MAGAAGVAAAVEEHGLVRLQVEGPMASNVSSAVRQEVELSLRALQRQYCDARCTDAEGDGAVGPLLAQAPVHYSGTPQGFINLQQAEVALHALARYLRGLGRGTPMSAGIITLNRPQRSLIQAMVDVVKGPLGLEGCGDHAWRRAGPSVHSDDVPLFIQSIDQIQGEERELILFATLLAPRAAADAPPPYYGYAEGSGAAADDGADTQEGEEARDELDDLEVETTEADAPSGRAGGGEGGVGEPETTSATPSRPLPSLNLP
jgi:hypothetical protein